MYRYFILDACTSRPLKAPKAVCDADQGTTELGDDISESDECNNVDDTDEDSDYNPGMAACTRHWQLLGEMTVNTNNSDRK